MSIRSRKGVGEISKRKRKKRSSHDRADERNIALISDNVSTSKNRKKRSKKSTSSIGKNRKHRSSSHAPKERSTDSTNKEKISKRKRSKKGGNERGSIDGKHQGESKNISKKRSSVSKKRTRTSKLPKRTSSEGLSANKIANGVIISLVALIIMLLIGALLKFNRAEVVSGSMEPTLMTHDKVVVINKKDIERFNLVVFYPPDKGKEKYVKRVIGIPGDKVKYKDDILYVNDKPMEESYLDSNKEKFYKKNDKTKKTYTADFNISDIPGVPKGTKKIPKDMYLMLGDNRQNSQDSRFIGLVPEKDIVGVVWKKDPMTHTQDKK